jgi:cyclopropane-fatty-acyl-phospholipid synthase
MLKKMVGEIRIPKTIGNIFDNAGIVVNGPNAWDITVFDSRAFDLMLTKWSLGLGEGYMRGFWD